MNEQCTLMTINEARELLARAVATQPPGFAYRGTTRDEADPESGISCYYTPRPDLFPASDPRSSTGCLVGTAMVIAGRELIPAYEGRDVLGLFGDLRLSYEASVYLSMAQSEQDDGATWETAYRAAEDWWSQEMFIRGHTDEP